MNTGRVLITGGAGFIGTHTARGLLAAGYRVRLFDNLTAPVHAGDGHWPTWCPVEAERVLGDVCSADDWRRALADVDLVVHLAAYQDLLPNFSRFFEVNAVGTALLYERIVADRLPVRKVVVASSQFVYGEGAYDCPTHGVAFPEGRDPQRLERGQWELVCPGCGGAVTARPLRETHAHPRNQYAISKYAQELMAIALGRNYGVPSVAMRYSIVQGPYQSFRNAYSG
ncbi:NAD(P)-dependent oxidoreductase, partial [bacterium]|nr:NAD(P)-dependent oxidoreductase [bacterium]